MTPVPAYRGLTWDHPRGRDALVAAAAQSGLDLTWDVHPLSGFEAAPIERLAECFDLIVLDHPHLGDAVRHTCLRPLEEVFGAGDVLEWGSHVVGPSLASYTLEGRVWAMPLDAATQVAATRTDLAGDPPSLWPEVMALAGRAPVALSLAGPHAQLTFSSVCVALGEEPAAGTERFVSEGTGLQALAMLSDLHRRAPRHTRGLDPIELLTEMCSDDTVSHCPLVFGYVNYASVALDRRITFSDAPSRQPGSRAGSTLGGTGLAITRRCEVTPELVRHLRWLLAPATQRDFIPRHSGQPALRSAWESEQVNKPVGGFYRATLRTVTEAWVRPRYAGYVGVQAEGAEVVREVLADATTPRSGLARLNQLYVTSLRESEVEGSSS